MDSAAVARMDARLDDIEREHGVTLLWAVESGSRAWGFPSPDSDYDCRFIYRRPLDDYLALWQPRDVVETPVDAELDVNGWDIGKALRLFLNGNAVVVEWLMSPIVYRGDPAFGAAFLDLAARHADRGAIGRHYLHLGLRQRRTYFADGQTVPLKKIFYALRPAAALRWLRVHPARILAPMHFPTLMQQCDPPRDVAALASELLARKAETREMGDGELPAVLAAFIDGEFEAGASAFGGRAASSSDEARNEAEAFLRDVILGRSLQIVRPPSTSSTTPVTNAASSEAR